MAKTLGVKVKFSAIDGLTAPFKKMTAGARKFSKSAAVAFSKVERRARKLNQSINKSIKGFGGIAAIAGGVALGTVISAGASAFVDLDKNISAASAKFGVFDRNSQVFLDIKKAAMDAGATTEFTSAQAAEGLNFLAMAGFNAQQSIASLPGVIDLATAAQIELGEATDIATDTLGAFGLMSDDATQLGLNLARVNNVMAATTTATNTSMVDLFETVKQAGPVFTGAGQSMETFNALAGRMASNSIKGSAAGTALKNAVLNLSAPSKKTQDAIDGLGIKIDDGTGNMRNMIDILDDVGKATAGMGNIQKSAALEALFGKRAIAGMSAILNEGVDQARALETSLKGVTNEASQMANFMRGGLSGVLAGMKSAFESIAIAIGDTFAPEIDATIKKLTKIARGAKDWVQNNKALIKTLVKTAVFVGKLIFALKAFLVVVNIVMAVKNAFIAFKAVMIAVNAVMFANPIGLIILAIIALIAVVAIVTKKWNDWGAAMSMVMGPLGMIISLIQSFRRNMDLIKDSFGEGGFLGGIKMIGKVLIDAIIMPLQQLLGLLSRLPGKIGKIASEGAIDIQAMREKLGVNTTTDERGNPLNAEAATERVRTERTEKTIKNSLGINISDETGRVSVGENSGGIPVNITPTVGFAS